MNDDKFFKVTNENIEYSKHAKDGYSECFIGIIDILGYSDFVKNETDAIQVITNLFEQTFFVNKLSLEDISYKLLSDTLIVYTNDLEQYSLINLIYALDNFAINCVEHGFLTRGAIVKGNHYIYKDIMISPAFIKAYELEEKEANYPRILVTNEVYQALLKNLVEQNDCYSIRCQNNKKSIEFVKDLLEHDFDNWFVIRPFRNIEIIALCLYENYKDFRGNKFRRGIDNEELISTLKRFQAGFKKIREKIKNNHVKGKFNYYARIFNDVLVKCNSFIDTSDLFIELFDF